MYCAKENGRNNFQFFTQGMNARAVERLTLENSLRVALERKELFLMYQPAVDIATGRIAGAEALLPGAIRSWALSHLTSSYRLPRIAA